MWKLIRFISEMMKPVWKAFRNREMPVLSKFGKMTWESEIQKYKLVTKLLIYKKNLFLFEDILWLNDSTSNITINNLIYIHVLHKKCDFIKYHCPWIVEKIKFELSIKTFLIVNILFILNPFIWVLFTLSFNFVQMKFLFFSFQVKYICSCM